MKIYKDSVLKIKRPIYDIILYFMIISANLGEIAKVGNIKLAWLFGASIVIVYIIFFINNYQLLKINHKNKKLLILFFYIWALYALFQHIFLVNKPYSFQFLLVLLINCYIVILIITNSKCINDVLYFNKAVIISLLINMIIAIWELRTGQHLVKLEGEQNIIYYSNKALATFGNGNDFATFLYFGIIAIFIDIIYNKKFIIFKIIIVFIAIILIIIINARGAIYGVVLLLAFWLFYYYTLRYINKSILIIFNIFAIINIFVIIIIILSTNLLESLIYKISSSSNINSDLYRLELIKGSLKIFYDSFFMGVGPGQSINILGMNIHNFFLEILAEYGIIIFIGIIGLFFNIHLSFSKIKNVMLASLNMAFVPSFVIISVSSSGANRIRATWIILAIIFSIINNKED